MDSRKSSLPTTFKSTCSWHKTSIIRWLKKSMTCLSTWSLRKWGAQMGQIQDHQCSGSSIRSISPGATQARHLLECTCMITWCPVCSSIRLRLIYRTSCRSKRARMSFKVVRIKVTPSSLWQMTDQIKMQTWLPSRSTPMRWTQMPTHQKNSLLDLRRR